MSKERELVDERQYKGQKILIHRVSTPNGEKFQSTWMIEERKVHISSDTATKEDAFDMMKIHIDGSRPDNTGEKD